MEEIEDKTLPTTLEQESLLQSKRLYLSISEYLERYEEEVSQARAWLDAPKPCSSGPGVVSLAKLVSNETTPVLSATATAWDRILLTWTDPSTSETGFEIERSEDSVNWTPIASVGSDVTEYLNLGRSAETLYYYRVRSVFGGATSGWSNTASATTPAIPSPVAPTNLTITDRSTSSLDYQWTDNEASDTYQEFQFRRSPTNRVADFNDNGVLLASGFSPDFSGEFGVSFWFRISATPGPLQYLFRAGGWNVGEHGLAILLGATDQIAISTSSPSGVLDSFQSAILTVGQWYHLVVTRDASNEITGHLDNVQFGSRTLAGDMTPSEDLRLGGDGAFDMSGQLSQGLVTPAELDASDRTALFGTGDPTLVPSSFDIAGASSWPLWEVGGPREDRFSNRTLTGVLIGSSAGPVVVSPDFSPAEVLGAGDTTNLVEDLAQDVEYEARVRTCNPSACSSYASTSGYTKTSPVENPAVSPDSDTELSVTWEDPYQSPDRTYDVERSSSLLGSRTSVATGIATLLFQDSGLSPDTQYFYHIKVSASVSGQESPEVTVSGTTDATQLATPTSLAATALDESRIQVTWDDNAAGEIGYQLERSPDGVGSWTVIAAEAAGVTSYLDTGLTAETEYFYRVRANASNPSAHSDYSNIDSDTTLAEPLDAPSGLVATPAGTTQIDLVWVDNSTGEAGFEIERSLDEVSWALIHTTAANVESYSDTGLSPDTEYFYRVKAIV